MFIETHRATVAPADCDQLGHMNVQHYFAAVSAGMFSIMHRLGLCPENIRRRHISFAVVRAETDFRRELRAGDKVVVETAVVRVGSKSVTFRHRLTNATTGEMAMTTEFKCVLLDLHNRRASDLPDDIRRAAGELRAEPAQ